MSKPKVAPYGSWRSPISAALLANGAVVPTELTLDGTDPCWLELHSAEGGRYALFTLRGGKPVEVLDPAYNARTRVHEYGGGSYLVHKGVVYFSNFRDQILYRKEPGGAAQPITKEGMRYAEYAMDERRARLVGVSEDHTVAGKQAVNAITEIGLKGSGRNLVSGNDFYSSVKLNPDQTRMAWLTWNHPNMPWDGTELWVGEIAEDGSVGESQLVAGGEEESVYQPEWSPDGTLYFVSDRSGWWNIYRWTGGSVERVVAMEAEFGRPQWSFRQSTYALESERRLVCSFLKNGAWHLGVLDTVTRRLRPIRMPYDDLSSVRALPGRALLIACSPTETGSVVSVDLDRGSVKVLYRPRRPRVDEGFISIPRHVRFTTTGGKKAYAFAYAPRNKNYRAPREERPPLIVMSHGGPTSFAPATLALGIQYWTSRGFAVLNVNYRGSTGYGRRYMKELEGRWGIVDVDDCTNGALNLARQGKADRGRLIIRGGSAGGFTTLCALTFKRVFGAGASHFGVSDLEGLENDTHKFESHYSDRLVAPYPERRDVYLDRSPLYHTDRLSTPVIFFQGLEDVVVPPEQSEKMVEALRSKGVPVAYIAFEGEQHGFRKAETIIRANEAESYFYARIFGFQLADKIKPVEIYNLAR